MFIDTHCHLDFPEFDSDRDEVIKRAKDQGISHIINISSSLQGSKNSIALSQKHDFIYAAVGIHPHEADGFSDEVEDILRELARSDKVVAIGEIGLDYYKNYSEPKNQKGTFISLLKLSKELNLPAVIHCRQADSDVVEILKEVMPQKIVVHCFSGSEYFLRQCLELGFFVSFTCNITYKKALNLRDLVRQVPLERLMLETDAPFLAPEGFRGRRNEPLYVKNLAQEIAKIKEIDVVEVGRANTANARFFFNLR